MISVLCRVKHPDESIVLVDNWKKIEILLALIKLGLTGLLIAPHRLAVHQCGQQVGQQ
jgi:hypothetical protein